ncbi:MAG TPA: ABC transporter permease [Opitutaceae bacterium]|jgi:predicted permease
MIAEFRRALSRTWAFIRRERVEPDLDEELESHIQFAVDENIRRGMAPAEARRQALIRLGGIDQVKEEHRDARSLPYLEDFAQDLRHTVRTLCRDRLFSTVAVLILALGIGANIVVFSVVNTILLRPLPFRDPQRLTWLATNDGKGGLSNQTYTVAAYEEFQRNNTSFESVTSYQTFFYSIPYKLTGRADPLALMAVEVAGNFFPTLGVSPMLGRLFTREECLPASGKVALLGYGFWKRQYAGDPSVVGKSISVNGAPVTVVGVLPASFDFGSVFSPGLNAEIFVPAVMDFWRGWGSTLALIGRLRPGVTVAQAQAEAHVLFPHLKAAHPDWYTDYDSKITSLDDHVTGQLRRSLFVLWCAVGLIMAIVCVNLSNLLLARTTARSNEFALRGALGARRGRLVRQLLTESLVLSGAGAFLGLGLAYGATNYLAHQGSIALPLLSSVRVDGAALAWTLLLTVLGAVMFGIAPAWRLSRANLQESLKEAGARMSHGLRHERMRSLLVASQIALACVLITGAGLLLRSFLKVLDVDLGFRPENTEAIKIEVNDGNDRAKRGAQLREIMDKVGALPGIESVGCTDMLPLDRNRSWGLAARGGADPKNRDTSIFVYVVTPGYLRTMGMHFVSGRDLSWQDGPDNESAIVINEAAARREWPNQDPLGRMAYGVSNKDSRVVGVISDVHESSVEQASSPEVYIPMTQADPEGVELVVRTKLPRSVFGPGVMETLRSLNPGQPRTQFRSITQIVDHSVSSRRFFAQLVSVFAAFGLLLAALGIYGVVSYGVVQRSREIGIRMALGASPSVVRMEVVMQTLRLALVGVGAGLVVSLGAGRLIASLLFATAPTDPLTFLATIAVLGLVALLAGFLPARQASNIDPIVVLRGR